MHEIQSYEFIDTNTIEKVKNTVYKLRNLWKPWSPHLQAHLPEDSKFMILGDTIYQLESNTDINEQLRNTMLQEFDFLYKHLIKSMELLTGVETTFRDDLPVPGFHISQMKFKPSERGYHVDDRIGAYANGAKSIALLSLIDSSVNGAGLEYVSNDGEECYFEYKFGMLHSWGPTLLHRIAINTMITIPGQTRMTLQGHCYFDKKLNKNILFF